MQTSAFCMSERCLDTCFVLLCIALDHPSSNAVFEEPFGHSRMSLCGFLSMHSRLSCSYNGYDLLRTVVLRYDFVESKTCIDD